MGCIGIKPSPVEAEIQVAVVGREASGKSTVVKQLRILHGENPFSELELSNFKRLVRDNLYRGLHDLVEVVGIDNLERKTSKHFAKILSQTVEEDFKIDNNTAASITSLWEDGCVKSYLKSHHKIDSEFNIEYFVGRLTAVLQEDYEPSELDILMARQKTTGLHACTFTTDSPRALWKFVDAGGQRSELRKWTFAFEESKAIIFTVALDEFDTPSRYAKNKTSIEESLELFETVVDNESDNKVVLLFLNKMDLFKTKLKDLRKTFPRFKGETLDDAIDFMAKMYLEMPKTSRPVFVYPTCALDKVNMAEIFDQVMNVIIKERIVSSKF